MSCISVIVAVYNESTNLPLLRSRLDTVLGSLDLSAEIVIVDDHSRDDSPRIIEEWAAQDSRVTYIRLSRNSGAHAAFSAGLRHCRGDCAVILAADLQDPPETIPLLLTEWRKGFDMVWARRASRAGEGKGSLSSRVANWIFERSLPNWPKGGVDFFLVNRNVLEAYKQIPEKNTSFVAVLLWMGFSQTVIEYEKEQRFSGVPKWSFSRKVKLFVDCIVSFSHTPIRIASYLGIFVSILGFIYATWIIIWGLAGHPVAGWSSLMVVVLVLGGVQLLVLGVLGEYLWRTFDEARQRPAYIIEKLSYGSAVPDARNRPGTSPVDGSYLGPRSAGHLG